MSGGGSKVVGVAVGLEVVCWNDDERWWVCLPCWIPLVCRGHVT